MMKFSWKSKGEEEKKTKRKPKQGNAIKVFQSQKFILPLSMAVVFKDKDQSADRGQSSDERRAQPVEAWH